jgi:hypothetical protein
MESAEQGPGLVWSDFELAEGEAPGELPGGELGQPVTVCEIVVECPVVVEIVGGGLSSDARDQVLTAMLDELAGVLRHA